MKQLEEISGIAAWVIAAAVAPALLVAALAGFLAGACGSELPSRSFLLVTDSAVTAVAEELVFRGLLLFGAIWALRAVNDEMPTSAVLVRAILLQAVAFALAHVLGLDLLQLGLSLVSSSQAGSISLNSFSMVSDSVSYFLLGSVEINSTSVGSFLLVVGLQAAAMLVQAFLFAVCMAYLALKTNNLISPILIHFLFDLIYFAPTVLASGSFPQTYLTGSLFDLAIVAISAAILAIPAVRVLIAVKRGAEIRPSKRVV